MSLEAFRTLGPDYLIGRSSRRGSNVSSTPSSTEHHTPPPHAGERPPSYEPSNNPYTGQGAESMRQPSPARRPVFPLALPSPVPEDRPLPPVPHHVRSRSATTPSNPLMDTEDSLQAPPPRFSVAIREPPVFDIHQNGNSASNLSHSPSSFPQIVAHPQLADPSTITHLLANSLIHPIVARMHYEALLANANEKRMKIILRHDELHQHIAHQSYDISRMKIRGNHAYYAGEHQRHLQLMGECIEGIMRLPAEAKEGSMALRGVGGYAAQSSQDRARVNGFDWDGRRHRPEELWVGGAWGNPGFDCDWLGHHINTSANSWTGRVPKNTVRLD